MFLVITFFESLIYSINGNFSLLVAVHSVNINLLQEEEDNKYPYKDDTKNQLEYRKTFFRIHKYIVPRPR